MRKNIEETVREINNRFDRVRFGKNIKELDSIFKIDGDSCTYEDDDVENDDCDIIADISDNYGLDTDMDKIYSNKIIYR